MECWTRLLLYGTYDGFSRSTDGDNNIIMILDNGERVEIPNHFVKNASDFVEKNKIKLKDIIARMEGLNGLTRLEWLDDILYKFGSNYGASKYKAGYEQGKLEGEWVGQQLKDADKIRQELNRPTVPQFVADWIEKNRGSLFGLNYDSVSSEIYDWVYEEEEEGNLKKLHLACAIGYTVEKEKRYYVRLKGVDENYNYFNCIKHLNAWCLTEIKTDKKFRTEHTKKQLEEAGFGWVFDCPGIEIEEVPE